MRYQATVVTAPEFELPDYSVIPAEIAREKVTDESVSRWIDQLREPHATYTPVEGRSLAMGDYAVVTYAATLDGAPSAKPFRRRQPSCRAGETPGSSWTTGRSCPAFVRRLRG